MEFSKRISRYLRGLARHKERYVRAWMAVYGVQQPAEMGELALVTEAIGNGPSYDDFRVTTRYHIERRFGVCKHCGRGPR